MKISKFKKTKKTIDLPRKKIATQKTGWIFGLYDGSKKNSKSIIGLPENDDTQALEKITLPGDGYPAISSS